MPQPIAFDLGLVQIHWYGLLIVLAIIFGLLLISRLGKKFGISGDEVVNLAFYVVIFSVIGARIYYLFLDLDYFLANPWQVFAIWRGGLAIHGAILGGLAVGFIYCFRKKQPFWLWADLIAPALALGQAIGRWGNYFNQEVFGRPTDLPWGIPILPANRPAGFESVEYFQPTFLYESGLNLVNFLVLLLLFKVFYLGKRKNTKAQKQKAGIVFLAYLINYSLIRFGMEFLRIDQTAFIGNIRLPQIVSIIIIVISICIIIFQRQRRLSPPTSYILPPTS